MQGEIRYYAGAGWIAVVFVFLVSASIFLGIDCAAGPRAACGDLIYARHFGSSNFCSSCKMLNWFCGYVVKKA